MPRHEPPGYTCPFCGLLSGAFDELNRPEDVVHRDELVLARISPKWWPDNPGAVLIMPVQHIENLYDVPREVGHAVWDLTQRVAVAMRSSYGCTGTSTRQHNEPDGYQDVWHLHVHVFPRHAGDRLYHRHSESRLAAPEERLPYAERLRAALAGHPC